MKMFSLKRKKRHPVEAAGTNREYRKVVLLLTNSSKTKISEEEIAKRLKSLNKPLGDSVSALLVGAVSSAIEKGQESVDITKLFNYSFSFAYGSESFPKEVVQEALMKDLLEIVEEKSEGEFVVKFK